MRRSLAGLLVVGVLALSAMGQVPGVGVPGAGTPATPGGPGADKPAAKKDQHKPKINFRTMDGKQVTNETLKGHVVVIDFWATWCGPCIQVMPHMKELYEKYSPMGVVVLGVSLDRSRKDLQRFLKAHKIAWPQFFDDVQGPGKMADEWKVNSIPRVFILAPDGTVFWTGHPDAMDQPMAEAVEKYKDDLVKAQEKQRQLDIQAGGPAAVEEGYVQLDAAMAAMEAEDYPAALAAVARIPEKAYVDNDFSLECRNFTEQVRQLDSKQRRAPPRFGE